MAYSVQSLRQTSSSLPSLGRACASLELKVVVVSFFESVCDHSKDHPVDAGSRRPAHRDLYTTPPDVTVEFGRYGNRSGANQVIERGEMNRATGKPPHRIS